MAVKGQQLKSARAAGLAAAKSHVFFQQLGGGFFSVELACVKAG